MNVHTEQTISHTENFVAHMCGQDAIGALQRILLNTLQLVIGSQDYIFQSVHARYPYCEANDVTFLWEKLSALNIKLDIQGAWKPSLAHDNDVFIMESFIDKGYSKAVLETLNNVRIYMKVIVLSDMSKYNVLIIVIFSLKRNIGENIRDVPIERFIFHFKTIIHVIVSLFISGNDILR